MTKEEALREIKALRGKIHATADISAEAEGWENVVVDHLDRASDVIEFPIQPGVHQRLMVRGTGSSHKTANEIVGYFCWVRSLSDEPTYEKRDKVIYSGNMIPETVKQLAGRTHCSYDLTAADWELPLEVLAKRFPCVRKLTAEEFEERVAALAK